MEFGHLFPPSRAAFVFIPFASIGLREMGFTFYKERKMIRLVSAATNVILQKLELKLEYFNEIDSMRLKLSCEQKDARWSEVDINCH